SFCTTTATSHPYTLSLHDALPICSPGVVPHLFPESLPGLQPLDEDDLLFVLLLAQGDKRADDLLEEVLGLVVVVPQHIGRVHDRDRKSTRLNSSHVKLSYAVFCLK